MMVMNKSNGMTLLEVMLALAIAASIVLMGLKQYQQYKLGQEIEQVRYNVNLLFKALGDYYFANCAAAVDGNPGVTGTLAPSQSPANPFIIAITTQLAGYLSNWPPLYNPLIDSTFGYTAQFNQSIQAGVRAATVCSSYWTPMCSSAPNPSSQIILWTAQVVVKMSDPTKTLAYQGLVNADCAVTSVPAARAINCSTTNGGDGVTTGSPAYLVWQRLPSFASPAMSSSLQGAGSVIKEFNMLYTHDPMAELYNIASYSTPNYLCGG
jgi:prepilin-type N-terminal cleavage/methylation domain-containing protein